MKSLWISALKLDYKYFETVFCDKRPCTQGIVDCVGQVSGWKGSNWKGLIPKRIVAWFDCWFGWKGWKGCGVFAWSAGLIQPFPTPIPAAGNGMWTSWLSKHNSYENSLKERQKVCSLKGLGSNPSFLTIELVNASFSQWFGDGRDFGCVGHTFRGWMILLV